MPQNGNFTLKTVEKHTKIGQNPGGVRLFDQCDLGGGVFNNVFYTVMCSGGGAHHVIVFARGV